MYTFTPGEQSRKAQRGTGGNSGTRTWFLKVEDEDTLPVPGSARFTDGLPGNQPAWKQNMLCKSIDFDYSGPAQGTLVNAEDREYSYVVATVHYASPSINGWNWEVSSRSKVDCLDIGRGRVWDDGQISDVCSPVVVYDEIVTASKLFVISAGIPKKCRDYKGLINNARWVTPWGDAYDGNTCLLEDWERKRVNDTENAAIYEYVTLKLRITGKPGGHNYFLRSPTRVRDANGVPLFDTSTPPQPIFAGSWGFHRYNPDLYGTGDFSWLV
jgi:hypothetical protein